MLEQPGAHATLTRLAESNLLLVPLDRHGDWCRYQLPIPRHGAGRPAPPGARPDPGPARDDGNVRIIVGIDGSDYSRKALDWPAREAGVRHAPLTVHQAAAGYLGAPIDYPGDTEATAKIRDAARRETDEVLDALGDVPRPESVTVQSVNGLPAQEILGASADADMVVVGSRGAGGFKQLLMGSVSSQVAQHVVIPHDDR